MDQFKTYHVCEKLLLKYTVNINQKFSLNMSQVACENLSNFTYIDDLGKGAYGEVKLYVNHTKDKKVRKFYFK